MYCTVCGAANETGNSVCTVREQPIEEDTGKTEAESLLKGRYRILTQVGTGGFGAVYKARDTLAAGQGTAIIAIKQVNLRGLTPQEIIEATDGFHREVLLLSNLEHVNLPHIYDSFTDPEHWYLVMDFIGGETLEQYLRHTTAGSSPATTRSLPLDEVFSIALQLCHVLHYLHTRQPPIIFRDLKPANVMRAPEGNLYLIDFGIARQFKPGQAKDTMPFGSPGYAAPEQSLQPGRAAAPGALGGRSSGDAVPLRAAAPVWHSGIGRVGSADHAYGGYGPGQKAGQRC